MPPSTKQKSRRKPGHGKMRLRRQGLRNAAPTAVRPGSPRARTQPEAPKPSTNQKMLYLLESLVGGVVTSYVGALAVKYGVPPEVASALLGVGNGAAAVGAEREMIGHASRGGASVAVSQLVLLGVGPKPNPPAPKIVAVQTPTPPAPPQRKNADLGALPPGMLDAAFENARAQLAVSGDGFPASFQPDHGHLQFHHGVVVP
jgi:hypothetical protein